MNVSPGETLTRFIRYNSHFSVVTNRVKPDAFLPLKARDDLSAAIVYENNLEVVPDEPPQKHANITPFPAENSPTDRKARRAIAIKLANASKLVVLPENT